MNLADLKPLIEILADGQFHSGEFLGERLGVTRAAVWKRLQSLALLDIPVETSKGRGYRIPGGLRLLRQPLILASLSAQAKALLRQFYSFDEVDSTNRFLLEEGAAGDVCVAERQTAGRGRRGRQWHSPYGCNLYLSLRWHFDQGVTALEGLSLAVGVLLAEALATLGLPGVELKWPNDLLCGGQKLGGVLIEIGGDLTGDCAVVAGVGLNVAMPAASEITQPWTDLHRQGLEADRNLLCATLLSALLPGLKTYPEQGFAAYRQRWEDRAAFRGEPIVLHTPAKVQTGILLGVDQQGGLRVQTDTGETVFSGGEISLRSSR